MTVFKHNNVLFHSGSETSSATPHALNIPHSVIQLTILNSLKAIPGILPPSSPAPSLHILLLFSSSSFLVERSSLCRRMFLHVFRPGHTTMLG